MAETSLIRVKICGLMRRDDALAADRAGADYVGVILSAGFSRSVTLANAAAIVAGTVARKVAVLVDETPAGAAAAATALGADVVQLSGDEPPETVEGIRALGSWSIWKAVRARSVDDLVRAFERYGERVDGILVEGWKEGSKGGSGTRVLLDAQVVRDLVPDSVDFVLAGGLAPDTVGEAVVAFRPDVVDVSSGVERAVGLKDRERVRAFVEAALAGTARAQAGGAVR